MTATASFAVTLGGLPVWALFVGWVTWLLRPGLVSSFALHAADALTGLVTLVPAMAVGAVAAFACQRVHRGLGG